LKIVALKGNVDATIKTDLNNMLKALEHDAEEIKNCVQCFVNSNEQPDNWYCLPCEPPHTLVYAKQKGYCYWPAKVIINLISFPFLNHARLAYLRLLLKPLRNRKALFIHYIILECLNLH
jgi:hypothetical protein